MHGFTLELRVYIPLLLRENGEGEEGEGEERRVYESIKGVAGVKGGQVDPPCLAVIPLCVCVCVYCCHRRRKGRL